MLESFGFRVMQEGKNFEGIQPKFVSVWISPGKTEEELLPPHPKAPVQYPLGRNRYTYRGSGSAARKWYMTSPRS